MTHLEELTKQRDEAYSLYDKKRQEIEKARRCVEKIGKIKSLKKITDYYQKISIEIERIKTDLRNKGIIKPTTQITVHLSPVTEKELEIKQKSREIEIKEKQLNSERQNKIEGAELSSSEILLAETIILATETRLQSGSEKKKKKTRENIDIEKGLSELRQDLEKLINEKKIIDESLRNPYKWLTKCMDTFCKKVDEILEKEFPTDEHKVIKSKLKSYSLTFINKKNIFASNLDKFICQEEVKKNELEKDYQEKNNLLTKFLVESVKKVETKTTILEEKNDKVWDKVFPAKQTSHNIYDFDTYYHWIGWYVFLLLTGYIGRKVYRAKNRKPKKTKNYLAEIRAIFKEWQLNMYASTAGYVVGFYLIQQAITKWINPRISNWLITQKLITLSVVCLIIGGGFYVDGIITSSLKTPLQRLGIKIENAAIDEKVKKSLLSKTQKVNELFKETLKRFGLLAVVGILTKLIAEFWNEHILTLLSYAVPIAGALKIIWEVDKTLKKLKLDGSKKN